MWAFSRKKTQNWRIIQVMCKSTDGWINGMVARWYASIWITSPTMEQKKSITKIYELQWKRNKNIKRRGKQSKTWFQSNCYTDYCVYQKKKLICHKRATNICLKYWSWNLVIVLVGIYILLLFFLWKGNDFVQNKFHILLACSQNNRYGTSHVEVLLIHSRTQGVVYPKSQTNGYHH